MQIRRAVTGDIAELQRIRGAVRENRLVSTVIEAADYVRHLDGERATWVAVDGVQIIGFAAGDRARANVWALFVDPACERGGAGRALHDAMMDWMFAGGLATVWLTTEPGTRAARFYRAAGWRVVGTTANGELRFELAADAWTRARTPR